MAVLTTDFDDDVGAKQEVDPCDKSTSVTVDDLRRGAREARFADDLQEAALERRVPTAVDNEVLDEPASPPARAPKRFQPVCQHGW